MQYTVMGEAVTLAEELEPANKLFETWIAIDLRLTNKPVKQWTSGISTM